MESIKVITRLGYSEPGLTLESGTWIPLPDGRDLALRNNVFDKLRLVFDYVPGDRSPPPAPKHTTAASNKPKVPKQAAQPRKAQNHGTNASFTRPTAYKATHSASGYHRTADEQYENISTQLNDDDSPEHTTLDSSSLLGEEDMLQMSQNSTGSRKRKRGVNDSGLMTTSEQEHIIYGDELLDYFMVAGDDPNSTMLLPPTPPANFQINRPIDDLGNTALHWAAAMGDIQIVKDLLGRGANMASLSNQEETPLVRAVLFTNNYEKGSMPKLVDLLQQTIGVRDWFGATVFHHLAKTTMTRSKWKCARFYCEVLVNKLHEIATDENVANLLMCQDSNGDTAVLVAARYNYLRLAMFLLTHAPEAGDITNKNGEAANNLIRNLSHRHEKYPQHTSSPVQPEHHHGMRNGNSSALMIHGAGPSPVKTHASQAASNLLGKIGFFMEDTSQKIANAYDTELSEKDSSVQEANRLLANMDAERHNVRQQSFTLMARAEDGHKVNNRRERYEGMVRENESLLEQGEHPDLQDRVLIEDRKLPTQLFDDTNRKQPSHQELQDVLPLARELCNQQQKRRALVKDIARLRGDAGTGEKVGIHRKLVAMATSLPEDQLDAMSGELIDHLDPNMMVIEPHTPVSQA